MEDFLLLIKHNDCCITFINKKLFILIFLMKKPREMS